MRRRSVGGVRARSSRAAANRERMVASAADMIGSHGVEASSFRDLLANSGAPRGSIYHYFPGGKPQLVREALAWTSKRILAYQRLCTADRPEGVVEHFVGLFRHSLVESDCRAGCPVASTALGFGSRDVRTKRSVKFALRAWIRLLESQLHATGLSVTSARGLATTTVAAVEGALVLCRAEGSVAPLDALRTPLRRIARASLRP